MGYDLGDAGDGWQVVWNAGFRPLLNQLATAERARFKEEHLTESPGIAAPKACGST